jgi:aspartate/tyrosine/aromatic aminotransferase
MAATSFDASVVPQAPEDPLFGLMAAYRRDNDPKKVDLGIGAYRDNNAKPWILPVVKQASTTFDQGSSEPMLTPTPGRRNPPQRSRTQPRVPAHCRSRRLHNRLTEARAWW